MEENVDKEKWLVQQHLTYLGFIYLLASTHYYLQPRRK